MKLDGFQDQRVEFQFKCIDFLFLKKYLARKQIKTHFVYSFCHLKKLQKHALKLCKI